MTQPCQMMVITLAVLATAVCPVDGEKGEWIHDPRTGKRYIELNETIWYQDFCSQVGGFEPEPKDEEENSFLAGLGTESIKLGINDAVKDGCWRYDRDDSEVSFFNWGHITSLTGKKPEPNGGYEAKCVIMMGKSFPREDGHDPKKWMDVKCFQLIYFKGLVCEKDCPDDRFGMNCTKDCHCSGVCHEVSGVCFSYCLPGWRGNDCQKECQDGKFGQNCTNDCQCENRVTEKCDHVNGSCLSACLPGRKGSDCLTQDSRDNVGKISISKASPLVLLGAVVGVAAVVFAGVSVILMAGSLFQSMIGHTGHSTNDPNRYFDNTIGKDAVGKIVKKDKDDSDSGSNPSMSTVNTEGSKTELKSNKGSMLQSIISFFSPSVPASPGIPSGPNCNRK